MSNRRIVVFALSFLLVSSFLFSINFQLVSAEPKTWTVDDDGPADYSTIQEAVDAASEGDTIFVRSGEYFESVWIYEKNGLKLQGENNETTIINGENSPYPYATGVGTNGDSTVISDFTIKNSFRGILIGWLEMAEIKNNIIENNTIGIHCGNITSYSTISYNVFTDNQIGVYVGLDSEFNTITNNCFSYNFQGLILNFSSNNNIYGNDFVDNNLQCVIQGGFLPSINLYDESINTWDNGYPLGGNYWSDYSGFDGNSDGIGDTPHILNPQNIDNYPLMNQNFDLEEPSIWTVDDDGPADFTTIQQAIDIAHPGDTIFVHSGIYKEKLLIDKNNIIIQGEDKETTIIDGETVSNNYYGIKVTQSYVNISEITIKHWFCGLYFGESEYFTPTNIILKNNIVEGNYWGIFIGNGSCNDNIIANNIFYNNNYIYNNQILEGYGLFLFGGNEDSLITDNSFLNNFVGLLIGWPSNSNVIYGNDFVHNTKSANVVNNPPYWESINIWNDVSSGNYWDDYDGIDENGDEIGDTPYIIDQNNQDNYPLLEMRFPDLDGDGIYNDIDTMPLQYSDEFSDISNGGVTTGYIIDRGDQILTINDVPTSDDNNDGVWVNASTAGGETNAIVFVNGGTANHDISPGDEGIFTSGSIYIKVITGCIESNFIAEDGTEVTTLLIAGSEVVVESSTLEIVNNGEIDAVVIVNDQEFSLSAGTQVRYTLSVDFDPDTLNLQTNGKWITAYIESSPIYDVANINLDTISLKANYNEIGPDFDAATCIGDYDNDGFSDLMIKFLRAEITSSLNTIDYQSETGSASEVKLTILAARNDGTSFSCSDTIRVLNSKK